MKGRVLIMFYTILAGQISEQTIAYIAVAVVVIGIILSFVTDGPISKKAIAKIRNAYEGKILETLDLKAQFRHTFITQDELIMQCNKKNFKVFKLSEIKCVKAGMNTSDMSFYFAAIDEKGNVMKGTWWGGSKLDDKLNGATVFRMPYDEAVKVCNLVAKYAPHVEISLLQDQYS